MKRRTPTSTKNAEVSSNKQMKLAADILLQFATANKSTHPPTTTAASNAAPVIHFRHQRTLYRNNAHDDDDEDDDTMAATAATAAGDDIADDGLYDLDTDDDDIDDGSNYVGHRSKDASKDEKIAMLLSAVGVLTTPTAPPPHLCNKNTNKKNTIVVATPKNVSLNKMAATATFVTKSEVLVVVDQSASSSLAAAAEESRQISAIVERAESSLKCIDTSAERDSVRAAAASGNAQLQFKVARRVDCLNFGTHKDSVLPIAEFLYRTTANAGHTGAINNLAAGYADGGWFPTPPAASGYTAWIKKEAKFYLDLLHTPQKVV